jgi:hypothetical protein
LSGPDIVAEAEEKTLSIQEMEGWSKECTLALRPPSQVDREVPSSLSLWHLPSLMLNENVPDF